MATSPLGPGQAGATRATSSSAGTDTRGSAEQGDKDEEGDLDLEKARPVLALLARARKRVGPHGELPH